MWVILCSYDVFCEEQEISVLDKSWSELRPKFLWGGECFSVLNPKLDDWKRSDLNFSVLPGIL